MDERLQKYLARAGVASRRHAEELIVAGRVAVNNTVVRELGTKVEPGRDLVTVDAKLVQPAEERVYFVLHKPPGVVTTMEDPQGRPTVAQYVQSVGRRVFPVGRLDFDAEGALLITDDGELAHALTHPSHEVRRTYLAKVKGTPTPESLARLREGVRLEDGMAKALEAEVFETADRNTWIRIVVGEGRQHLVKRLCAAIGHPVVRLYRPAQGGIGVEGLRPGALRALTSEEVERLKGVARGAAPPLEPFSLPPRRHGRGAPSFGEGAEARDEGRSGRVRGDEGGGRRAYGGRGGRKFDARGAGGRGVPERAARGFGERGGRSSEERDARAYGGRGGRKFEVRGAGERVGPERGARGFGERDRRNPGGRDFRAHAGRGRQKFDPRGAGERVASERGARGFEERRGRGAGERDYRPYAGRGEQRFDARGTGERVGSERGARGFEERRGRSAGERDYRAYGGRGGQRFDARGAGERPGLGPGARKFGEGAARDVRRYGERRGNNDARRKGRFGALPKRGGGRPGGRGGGGGRGPNRGR